MYRNIGIYTLILCFLLSNTSLGLADQVVNVPPVVVQPYGLQQLNQQDINIDRKDRDQEVDIKDLVDQNDQLVQASLVKQQDAALANLDQTLVNYSKALTERDRQRILANEQRIGDEDRLFDPSEGKLDPTLQKELVYKGDMLAQKFQLLSILKDEMIELNEKLSNQQNSSNPQQESGSDQFKKLAQEQQEKMQALIASLNAMDAKISQLDALLAQKEEQITQLSEKLTVVQGEAAVKDETIKEQNDKIALLEGQSKSPAPVSSGSVTTAIAALAPIIVNPPQAQQMGASGEVIAAKDQIIKEQQNQINALRDQLKNLSPMSAKVADLPAITVNLPSTPPSNLRLAAILMERDNLIKAQQDQIAKLKLQLNNLSPLPKLAALPPINVTLPQNNFSTVSSKITAVAPITVNPPFDAKTQINLIAQLMEKDKLIKAQEDQIAQLNAQLKIAPPVSVKVGTLPPIMVNPPATSSMTARTAILLKEKDELIRAQQLQITILKLQLKNSSSQPQLNKITALPPINVIPPTNGVIEKKIAAKDRMIEEQQEQIQGLKEQAKELMIKDNLVQSQADEIKAAADQFKGQDALFESIQAKIVDLKNKVIAQNADLKSKNDSIHWLNQALTVTKDKAKYYELASQMGSGRLQDLQKQRAELKSKDNTIHWLKQALSITKDKAKYYQQISETELGRLQEIQHQVKNIQGDFAQRLDDYNHFEQDILNLKQRLGLMGNQLVQKQDEIGSLKSQLADMKHNQAIEMQRFHGDDRLSLAKQLIMLQEQEASLLLYKGELEEAQNKLFDEHANAFERRIKELMAQHKIQNADLLNRLQAMQGLLSQKEDQEQVLQGELKDKIAQERNQTVLLDQIQDLNSKLKYQDSQIADLQSRIMDTKQSSDEVDSLKQQLAASQDTVQQLKTQLNNKITESDQMTQMMGDYQQKLEAKDLAYNKQYGRFISFRKYEAAMALKIASLNSRLQLKESEIVKIKKDMYDLQQSAAAKNMDLQANDLSQAMLQQRQTDEQVKQYQDKINTLQTQNEQQAQEITRLKTNLNDAQDKLANVPSSDEVTFLRTGLKKATDELRENQDALEQIKLDTQQYTNEDIKEELLVQHLKKQLWDIKNKFQNTSEDLKYKNMALIRLKERSQANIKDLKAQVAALTLKLGATENKLMAKTNQNKLQDLQLQLKRAEYQNKSLESQVKELKAISATDVASQKLKEALDKIDQQGRIISVLAQKLEDCGQKVDLTKIQ